MVRRNLDTQGTGRKARNLVETIISDSGHLFQPIDGDLDNSIDGYIRIRKKIKFNKVIKNKTSPFEDYVETGNLIGIQIKGVSKIPKTGSNSYYVSSKDKSKFGVNFSTKKDLEAAKSIWKNFIGPIILVFVDLETKKCWWTDLNNDKAYSLNEYSVAIDKKSIFNESSFKEIKKLGRELFVTKQLINIDTANHHFLTLGLTDFKNKAKKAYDNLSGSGEFYTPTVNPILGQIFYTKSGWRHLTRLNRRKMRIINSLLLLGVSKTICEKVEKFTTVKKGTIRESNQYIKKVDFITLRATVNFNFRQSSIVQVVLRRVKTFDKLNGKRSIPEQFYFHSVYEPYRKE